MAAKVDDSLKPQDAAAAIATEGISNPGDDSHKIDDGQRPDAAPAHPLFALADVGSLSSSATPFFPTSHNATGSGTARALDPQQAQAQQQPQAEVQQQQAQQQAQAQAQQQQQQQTASAAAAAAAAAGVTAGVAVAGLDAATAAQQQQWSTAAMAGGLSSSSPQNWLAMDYPRAEDATAPWLQQQQQQQQQVGALGMAMGMDMTGLGVHLPGQQQQQAQHAQLGLGGLGDMSQQYLQQQQHQQQQFRPYGIDDQTVAPMTMGRPRRGGVQQRRAPMYSKTKLCAFFPRGCCANGANCSFAHGEPELRPRPYVPSHSLAQQGQMGMGMGMGMGMNMGPLGGANGYLDGSVAGGPFAPPFPQKQQWPKGGKGHAGLQGPQQDEAALYQAAAAAAAAAAAGTPFDTLHPTGGVREDSPLGGQNAAAAVAAWLHQGGGAAAASTGGQTDEQTQVEQQMLALRIQQQQQLLQQQQHQQAQQRMMRQQQMQQQQQLLLQQQQQRMGTWEGDHQLQQQLSAAAGTGGLGLLAADAGMQQQYLQPGANGSLLPAAMGLQQPGPQGLAGLQLLPQQQMQLQQLQSSGLAANGGALPPAGAGMGMNLNVMNMQQPQSLLGQPGAVGAPLGLAGLQQQPQQLGGQAVHGDGAVAAAAAAAVAAGPDDAQRLAALQAIWAKPSPLLVASNSPAVPAPVEL